jgi:hypothetical protein
MGGQEKARSEKGAPLGKKGRNQIRLRLILPIRKSFSLPVAGLFTRRIRRGLDVGGIP